MANLTRASQELFRRPPDERFASLGDLHRYCQTLKDDSRRIREAGSGLRATVADGGLALTGTDRRPFRLNDWSFSQLCSLAGVARDTVNRLRSETAAQVFNETLAGRLDDEDELQLLVDSEDRVRSVNGSQYKRLWSADLLAMLMEFATDFTPPQPGIGGATGLYAGEQDMFCFLIDSAGWTDIGGEAFAPGFFVWNSEVGRRTVGISTFWFQKVCQNHIVWDATDVVQITRRHTGRARESLAQIRQAVEELVARRDERKDGFARIVASAMQSSYGSTSEEVQGLLAKAGFTKALAKRAAEIAQQKGAFTLWSVVDALTQLSQETRFAGLRADADQKASSLLALATAL